jgi:hypothetical protein
MIKLLALKKIGTKIIKLMFNCKNFFNKSYYLVTPRTHSFGGVMEMYIGIKSALIQKKNSFSSPIFSHKS